MSEKWKLPVLLSFAYYRKDIDLAKLTEDFDLLIDSGAFSVKTSGKEILIDNYIDFIKTSLPKGVPYFNLDVIGNAEESYKNYKYLMSKGLHPVPIVTRDGTLADIERYYKTSDYVGFGGLKDSELNISIGNPKHVKWLMEKGVKGRKCHWLGFCNINFIKYYRPTSCDSVTWKQAQMFGKIYVLTETGMHLLGREKLLNASLPIRHAVTSLGFDIGELYAKENWHGGDSLAQLISTCMYIKFSRLISKKTGTKMYLVSGGKNDFDQLLKAKKYLEENDAL